MTFVLLADQWPFAGFPSAEDEYYGNIKNGNVRYSGLPEKYQQGDGIFYLFDDVG